MAQLLGMAGVMKHIPQFEQPLAGTSEALVHARRFEEIDRDTRAHPVALGVQWIDKFHRVRAERVRVFFTHQRIRNALRGPDRKERGAERQIELPRAKRFPAAGERRTLERTRRDLLVSDHARNLLDNVLFAFDVDAIAWNAHGDRSGIVSFHFEIEPLHDLLHARGRDVHPENGMDALWTK